MIIVGPSLGSGGACVDRAAAPAVRLLITVIGVASHDDDGYFYFVGSSDDRRVKKLLLAWLSEPLTIRLQWFLALFALPRPLFFILVDNPASQVLDLLLRVLAVDRVVPDGLQRFVASVRS